MERRLRLREEADFRRVRAAGRSWGNRWMTLLALPNALPHNRYGFVVGKRVGKAVARNLVKRRLRETLRQLDRAGRIAPGHDLAFIVRPALAGATFAETRDAVADLLGRARLLDPPQPPPPDGAAASGAGDGEQRVESQGHDQVRAGRD
jgi:ribonuclease P protein component